MTVLAAIYAGAPLDNDDVSNIAFANDTDATNTTTALDNTPADFGTMDDTGFTLHIRYSLDGTSSGDTYQLLAGIRNAANTAHLAGATSSTNKEMDAAVDGTTILQADIDLSGAAGDVNTTADKTAWDGALVSIQQNWSQDKGPDAQHIIVYQVWITGNYTIASGDETVTAVAVDAVATVPNPTVGVDYTVTAVVVAGTTTVPAITPVEAVPGFGDYFQGAELTPFIRQAAGSMDHWQGGEMFGSFGAAAAGGDETTTPTVVAGVTTVPAPTVAVDHTVTAVVVAGVSTVPIPTLGVDHTVTAVVVAGVSTVPTPTVLADTTVTAVVVAGTSTVPTPTVGVDVASTIVVVAGVTTVPTPTLGVDHTVTAVVVAGVTTVPTPTTSVGTNATTSPTVVAGLTTVPTPTVLAGVEPTVAVVAGVTTVPTPTVLAAVTSTLTVVTAQGYVPMEPWLALDGNGDYASAPDTAGLSVTGDIDLRVYARNAGWVSGAGTEYLIDKASSADSFQYGLALTTAGNPQLFWSEDGPTLKSASSTAAVSFADGARGAVRATLDVDNGAGGYDVTFYTATSIDGTWSQLGSVVTVGATTSIFDGADPVWIGASENNSDVVYAETTGDIYAAEIYDGIDGTRVANFRADAYAPDSEGNTWTLNGDAYVVLGRLTVTVGTTVSPTVVAGTTTVPTPTTIAGVPAVVAVVAGTSTVPTPTVTATTSVTVTPTVVAGVTTVPTPTTTGTIPATVTVVAGTTNIRVWDWSMGPGMGGTEITVAVGIPPIVSVVGGVGTVPTPTVIAGVTITPTVVAGVSTVPTPTIAVDETVTATVVAGTTTVPTPTVSGTIPATVSVVIAVATVPTPAMVPVDVPAVVSVVVATAVIYLPEVLGATRIVRFPANTMQLRRITRNGVYTLIIVPVSQNQATIESQGEVVSRNFIANNPSDYDTINTAITTEWEANKNGTVADLKRELNGALASAGFVESGTPQTVSLHERYLTRFTP